MSPRFAFEPVERLLIAQGTVLDLRWRESLCGDDRGTTAALAEALNVHPATIRRWRVQGLTACTADRVAVRLGLTPHLLWPEWGRTLVPS